MKDNSLWAIVVIVVIILAIFLLGSGGGTGDVVLDETTNTPNTIVTPTPVKPTPVPKPVAGMKTSLGGIFDVKGSYQCDYDSVTTSTRTSNVVYVADGKLRGEFRTLDALLSKSTIVVYDGDYLYTWTEGKSTGTISQPKTLADLPGVIPQDVSSGKILGQGLSSVSWNCHAWAKSAGLLSKPTYVQFN